MGSTWDAYIDSLLGSHEGVKRGAIISATDGSIWARSKDAAEFKVRYLHMILFMYTKSVFLGH